MFNGSDALKEVYLELFIKVLKVKKKKTEAPFNLLDLTVIRVKNLPF